MDQNAADWLKYVKAVVERTQDTLAVAVRPADIMGALGRLDNVRELLCGIVNAYHGETDMAHYADGRPVVGCVVIGDSGQYIHTWLPNPAQNPPDEVCVITTPDGVRKRVIVSAPGHLDVISDAPEDDSARSRSES